VGCVAGYHGSQFWGGGFDEAFNKLERANIASFLENKYWCRMKKITWSESNALI